MSVEIILAGMAGIEVFNVGVVEFPLCCWVWPRFLLSSFSNLPNQIGVFFPYSQFR
jgi:hypothetical protein